MQTDLIAHQLPGLRRYARALTGDSWAADDLVQDTLERACAKWRLWTAGSDLRAWLFTIMHNVYLNERRGAHARIVPVPIEDVEETLAAPHRSSDDALDLQRCLLLLPDDQRAVLLLVTLEDMDYEQAARVLGIPAGTVMSRLSRARSRLRGLMEGGARGSNAALSQPVQIHIREASDEPLEKSSGEIPAKLPGQAPGNTPASGIGPNLRRLK